MFPTAPSTSHDTSPSASPDQRTPADDAAYHRREAIRLTARGKRLKGHAAEAAYAEAEIHALLARIADGGEPIPDYVRDNMPAFIAWTEAPE